MISIFEFNIICVTYLLKMNVILVGFMYYLPERVLRLSFICMFDKILGGWID